MKHDSTPPRLVTPRHSAAPGLVGVTLQDSQHCTYCRDHLAAGESLLICPACKAVFHTECAPEGRCSTLGCANGSAAAPARRPRRRWRRVAGAILAATLLTVIGFGVYIVTLPVCIEIPTPALTLQLDDPLPSTVQEQSPGTYAEVRVSGFVRVAERQERASLTVAGVVVPIRWTGFADTSGGRCGIGAPEGIAAGGCYEGTPDPYAVGPGGTFATVVRLAPGLHDLDVVLTSPGHQQIARKRVTVRPRHRPQISPPVVLHPVIDPPAVPRTAATAPRDVLLRGQIDSGAPVRVTVDGPSGRIQWDTVEPGAFGSSVTVPDAGAHVVDVTVQDAWGRSSVTRFSISGYEVQRVTPQGDAPMLVGN